MIKSDKCKKSIKSKKGVSPVVFFGVLIIQWIMINLLIWGSTPKLKFLNNR